MLIIFIGFLGLCVRLANVVLARLITPVGNEVSVRVECIETLYTRFGIVASGTGRSLTIGEILRNFCGRVELFNSALLMAANGILIVSLSLLCIMAILRLFVFDEWTVLSSRGYLVIGMLLYVMTRLLG